MLQIGRSRYDLGSSQTVVVNVDRFYNEATLFARKAALTTDVMQGRMLPDNRYADVISVALT